METHENPRERKNSEDPEWELTYGVMQGKCEGAYGERLRELRMRARENMGAAFNVAVYESDCEILLERYVRGDGEAMEQLMKRATIDNERHAQYLLGRVFSEGLQVLPSMPKAAEWFHKAAWQGHPIAQGILGFMTRKGLGVPRNDVLAYGWLKLAEEQGGRAVRGELQVIEQEFDPISRRKLYTFTEGLRQSVAKAMRGERIEDV